MLKLKSKTNDHEDNMLYKKVVPCHLPFSGCLCLNLCATSHGYFAGKNLFLLGSFDGWTLQTYLKYLIHKVHYVSGKVFISCIICIRQSCISIGKSQNLNLIVQFNNRFLGLWPFTYSFVWCIFDTFSPLSPCQYHPQVNPIKSQDSIIPKVIYGFWGGK